jgi:uncharacterized membrane protein
MKTNGGSIMRNGIGQKLTSNPEQLAEALGWFSIGLGIVELAAPRLLARLIGVNGGARMIRMYGLREIVNGIAILGARNQKGRWVQARVAGDALDLASLGVAMVSPDAQRGKVALATMAVAGVTALDTVCSMQLCERPFAKGKPLNVKKSVTINRSREELYQFWRKFEQLPCFMSHLESVTEIGPNLSRWEAKGPAGVRVAWEAQLIDDKPNERIAWRSLDGADVDNAGVVQFKPAPGGRGTIVEVEMTYNPPAGKLGAVVAKILGEAPEKQVDVELRRFKQLMETGEIARTEGQSAGRSRSTSRKYDDLVRA